MNRDGISTTVKFILKSSLSFEAVTAALDVSKITQRLANEGYDVEMYTPLLTNLASRASILVSSSSVSSDQPNIAMTVGLTIGLVLLAFIAGLLLYFRYTRKVPYPAVLFLTILISLIPIRFSTQKYAVPTIPWSNLEFSNGPLEDILLGEGSSGLVLRGVWHSSRSAQIESGRRSSAPGTEKAF